MGLTSGLAKDVNQARYGAVRPAEGNSEYGFYHRLTSMLTTSLLAGSPGVTLPLSEIRSWIRQHGRKLSTRRQQRHRVECERGAG